MTLSVLHVVCRLLSPGFFTAVRLLRQSSRSLHCPRSQLRRILSQFSVEQPVFRRRVIRLCSISTHVLPLNRRPRLTTSVDWRTTVFSQPSAMTHSLSCHPLASTSRISWPTLDPITQQNTLTEPVLPASETIFKSSPVDAQVSSAVDLEQYCM